MSMPVEQLNQLCAYHFVFAFYAPLFCQGDKLAMNRTTVSTSLGNTAVCIGNYEREAKHLLRQILDPASYDSGEIVVEFDWLNIQHQPISEQQNVKSYVKDFTAVRNVPPTGGVDVAVDLIVQDLSDISEKSRTFTMDLLYSQIWHDERLDYTELAGAECLENITLSYKMVDKIWIPNVCFVNTVHALVHNSPTRNIFLVIYPNGTVWTNYRVQVTLPCEMDFSSFPMDAQQCLLVFESFSFNMARVRLKWKPGLPIDFQMNKNRILPEFVFTNHLLYEDKCLYPTGMWDQLKVVFMFRRGFGFYVLQVYVPTFAIVVLSWIAFWIDTDAVPARVTLGATSLMAIITQYGIVARGLPKVSYVKSLDIWILFCIGFIIMTVIELPIVTFYEKKNRELRKRAEKASNTKRNMTRCVKTMTAPIKVEEVVVYDYRFKHKCIPDRRIPRKRRGGFSLKSFRRIFRQKLTSKVDRISRLLFPGLFGIFNVVYWWYYTFLSRKHIQQMLDSGMPNSDLC